MLHRRMARPVAQIVGGGTGIGAATARRLAADGWAVCVSGRRAQPLEEVSAEIGGLAVVADTSDPTDAESAVAAIVETYGRLDALVFAAGTGASGAVADQSLERWNRVMATNLTGAFLACRAALPPLLEIGGAIVAVSSLAGLRASPASAAYCTSKAGLIMLTQSIAADYARRGVRANCVCPGWIRTAIADAEMDSLAERLGGDREDAYAKAVAEVPAGRAGTPDEAADAIAWLVSEKAGYVNGTVIGVDGGTAIVDAGALAFRPPAA